MYPTQTCDRYTTSMMAKDTLALIKHLNWTQAHIVGASMGGMIALELASMAPDRIASLTLIVTHASIFSYVQSIYHQWRGMMNVLWSQFQSPEDKAATVLDVLYPPEYLDGPASSQVHESNNMTRREKMHEFHLQNILRGSPNGQKRVGARNQLLATLTHHMSAARLHMIRNVGFPILVIGSRKDALIHVSNTERLYARLASNHTIKVIFPNAGHAVTYQERHSLADLLISIIHDHR